MPENNPTTCICEACGKEFASKSGHANRFCTLVCYWNSPHKRKPTQPCEGCGQQFTPVAGHANRFCSFSCYWNSPHPTRAADERFWEKVQKNGPLPSYNESLGPCWIWTAAKNPKGYGLFSPGKDGHIGAHVFAYELENGPIPDGREIDHKCRVHACVRPDHLEAVTHQVNMLRGMTFAAAKSQQTHCIHGHIFDTQNTLIVPNGTRRCRKCKNERDRLYYHKVKALNTR